MADAWPTRIDHDTEAYWQGLRERKLQLARCRACEHWIHPPRACCPVCWSDDIGREAPSGKATLFSYLVQATGPDTPPTIVGWAELAEQTRLLVVAPIEGVTAETVEIGAELVLGWRETGGQFLPIFRAERWS
ncbi:MAG: hypothetical protein JWQ29_1005 [Phenylobacterium sp.]|nr:hypothetical protein [Phenylobacterium sp.]